MDPGDEGHQLGPLGVRGQEPERRVRLEHLVLWRADTPDLKEVVHHADRIESGVVCRAGDRGQRRPQLRWAARPREVGYL